MVVAGSGKIPGRGEGLLNRERLSRAVFDGCRTPQDAGGFIDLVIEYNEDLSFDVLHGYSEAVAVDLMRYVVEHEIAIAVGEGDFQIGGGVQAPTPAGELLRSGVDRRIERGPAWQRVRLGKRIGEAQARAPVDRLQLAVRVYSKDIAHTLCVDTKDVGLGVIVDRPIAGGSPVGRHRHGQQAAQRAQPSQRPAQALLRSMRFADHSFSPCICNRCDAGRFVQG